MTQNIFANLAWYNLNGPHADYACGNHLARRYAKGFAPLIGFADPQHPDFAALEPYCARGEPLYCAGWSGAAPLGWQIEAEAQLLQMVWQGTNPADDPEFDATPLDMSHINNILALAAATQPGPFGERAIALGEYFGAFEGKQLIAMAGERFAAPGLREISAVCTHPDFQGLGLARRLIVKLIQRQRARGLTPFIQVLDENVHARRLYERMGFAYVKQLPARIVSRNAN